MEGFRLSAKQGKTEGRSSRKCYLLLCRSLTRLKNSDSSCFCCICFKSLHLLAVFGSAYSLWIFELSSELLKPLTKDLSDGHNVANYSTLAAIPHHHLKTDPISIEGAQRLFPPPISNPQVAAPCLQVGSSMRPCEMGGREPL